MPAILPKPQCVFLQVDQLYSTNYKLQIFIEQSCKYSMIGAKLLTWTNADI